MIKRISKNISFTSREIKQLDAVVQDTGMNASEVIRQLINKAFIDKKTRQIITMNSYQETVDKRVLGKTSHNVQCVNEKKDEASHETSTAVSSNCRLNDILERKKIQEGLFILKHQWRPNWETFFTMHFSAAVKAIKEARKKGIDLTWMEEKYNQIIAS